MRHVTCAGAGCDVCCRCRPPALWAGEDANARLSSSADPAPVPDAAALAMAERMTTAPHPRHACTSGPEPRTTPPDDPAGVQQHERSQKCLAAAVWRALQAVCRRCCWPARGARRADLPGQGAEDGRRHGALHRLAAQGRGDHGGRRVHCVDGRLQLGHARAQAWGGAGQVRLRVRVRWLPGRGAWRRIRQRLMKMCVATK